MCEFYSRSKPRPILKKSNSKSPDSINERPRFFAGSSESSDDSDSEYLKQQPLFKHKYSESYHFQRFNKELIKCIVKSTNSFIEKHKNNLNFIQNLKWFLQNKSHLSNLSLKNHLIQSEPDLTTIEELSNEVKSVKNLIYVKQLDTNKKDKLHEVISCSLPTCHESSFLIENDYLTNLNKFNSYFQQKKNQLNTHEWNNYLHTYETQLKTKKIVRFADSLGLDLANIRMIQSDEFSDLYLVESPKKSIITENIQRNQDHLLLIPKFTLQKNENLSVSLDGYSFDYDYRIIKCTVRVKNFSYDKRVFARITLNNWKTYNDADAIYNESKGDIDYFVFFIFIPEKRVLFKDDSLFNMSSKTLLIEFALCYVCTNDIYWDNNNFSNYKFECCFS